MELRNGCMLCSPASGTGGMLASDTGGPLSGRPVRLLLLSRCEPSGIVYLRRWTCLAFRNLRTDSGRSGTMDGEPTLKAGFKYRGLDRLQPPFVVSVGRNQSVGGPTVSNAHGRSGWAGCVCFCARGSGCRVENTRGDCFPDAYGDVLK
jgi:hypothetical protein